VEERVTAIARDEALLDDRLFRAAGGSIVHDSDLIHHVSLPTAVRHGVGPWVSKRYLGLPTDATSRTALEERRVGIEQPRLVQVAEDRGDIAA
jgi:hypothetical protein